MSGFGLLWLGRESPGIDARRTALREGIRWRGSQEPIDLTLPTAYLAHAQRITTPEAARERQPSKHVDRPIWVVADVRLDNRDELDEKLRGHVAQPLDTDVDFLLAAYELWGDRLAEHLLGDYGFAVLDSEREQVTVVRDHVGIRPVYWARGSDGSFAVSSTLRSTLLASGLPRNANSAALARLALFDHSDPVETEWADVQRLPGGHVLVAATNGQNVRRYWDPRPPYRPVSIDAAATEVRRLFDQAVLCRLRAPGRVGVEVSGGFDSTSVAASAVKQVGHDRLFALSMTFPGLDCDESEYVDAASVHLGLPIHRIDATSFGPIDFRSEVESDLGMPSLPDSEWCDPSDGVAAKIGCAVVLTGQGGDHVLYGDASSVPAVMALSGHPFRAFAMVRRPTQSIAKSAVRLARSIGTELLGRSPAGLFARTVRWCRPSRRPRPPAFLSARAAESATLRPTSAPTDRERGPWRVQREYRRSNYTGSIAWFAELWDRSAAHVGIENRCPYVDVRLIEYVMSLGEDVVTYGANPRGLHRLAMLGELPPLLLARTDKAEFSTPWRDAGLRAVARLETEHAFTSPMVDELLNVAALRERTEQLRSEEEVSGTLWPWWGAVSVVLWLQSSGCERLPDVPRA